MKRKRWYGFVVLCFALLPVISCEAVSSRERAELYGATAKIGITVVDEDNVTVSNAEIVVYFGMSVREGKTVKGHSVGDGPFIVEGKTTGDVYVDVRKHGFYHSAKKMILSNDKRHDVVAGRWIPNLIPCRISLRKIHKPVTLISTERVKGYGINNPRTWMGFDMEKADWVPPYGNGVTTDFEVMYDSDGKKLFDYTGSKLSIRFIRPFDGAYVRHKNFESDFQADFEVKTNESYQTILEYSERKIGRGIWDRTRLSKEQFLVLRIRSQVDAQGKFKGAHYGMILGPMSYGWDYRSFGVVGLHTVFNPVFNDTSLEKKSVYNTSNFGQIGGSQMEN